MTEIPATLLNTITTGDARELARALPDNSIDLVFTDPPYPREYLPLYGWLAEESARVLKPGGLCLAMAGHSYLPEIYAAMAEHLNYHWTHCYLMLGGQAAQVWPRKVITFWKPIVSFVKGEYTGAWQSDVVQSNGNDKRFHHWGQSESGCAAALARYSQSNALVFDPFAGGGTVPAVCKMLNRNYVAFEIDAATAERARQRVDATQAMHPAFTVEQEVMALE